MKRFKVRMYAALTDKSYRSISDHTYLVAYKAAYLPEAFKSKPYLRGYKDILEGKALLSCTDFGYPDQAENPEGIDNSQSVGVQAPAASTDRVL